MAAEFITAHIGELAALTTSVLWAITSTMFTFAGRRVGSVVVNRMRLLLAIVFLVLAHLVLGISLPFHIEPQRMFWLSLSGIIGLTLGDAFLFQAFVVIGPRISMLLMSLAPVIGALVAWVFLGEKLTPLQMLGMALTIGGVAWVVTERNGVTKDSPVRKAYLVGVLFGLAGATGQALGLVAAKQGLSGDFSPLSGTLIRMIAAAATIWMITLIQRRARYTFRQIREHPRSIRFILVGALTGPFLGVTFSLLAVQRTQVGIASTLMALPPVILLPIGYFVFKERFGWQAITGTLLAMLGVALLFVV